MSETTEKDSGTGFRFPEFQMPKFGPPDGLRETSAQWVDQNRKNFDTVIAAAEEAFGAYGASWSTAAKCSADCVAKLTEAMQKNTDSAFDLAHELMAAKSLPDVIDISTSGARRQFDAFAAQNQELWSFARDAGVETMRSLNAVVPKAFQTSSDR